MPAPKYTPHYTLADYRSWEGNWELWSGIPVAMGPSPFGKHQKLVTEMARRLLNAIDEQPCDQCEVAVELDWIISDDLVVRPDVVVCCGSDIDEFIRSRPSLIVEVLSSSTEHKDRTAKFELYQQQQVPYYLLIDPQDNSAEAYHLSNNQYEPLTCSSGPRGLPIKLHPNCQITLTLPPPSNNPQP